MSHVTHDRMDSSTLPILNSYVTYQFDNPLGGVVYNSLCKLWLHAATTSHPAVSNFKAYSFLFEIIFKSMALHLHVKDMLNVVQRNEANNPENPPEGDKPDEEDK